MSPVEPSIEAILVGVFREQRARLWSYLSRGAGGAAEDLLQEVFLRAWSHRERLQGERGESGREAVRRFLWRIARNLVIDEIRTSSRRRESHRQVSPPGAASPGHEQRVILSDAIATIRKTVTTLPNATTRRCLEGWLAGVEIADIARSLALSVDQVRGHLQRGRSEVIRRAADRLRVRPIPRAGDDGGES